MADLGGSGVGTGGPVDRAVEWDGLILPMSHGAMCHGASAVATVVVVETRAGPIFLLF